MRTKTIWLLAGLTAGGLAIANRCRRQMNTQAWREQMGQAGPRTALITGASSGIGAVYAQALASQGYDLILVARREDRLIAMAEVFRRQQGVQVEVVAADLTEEAGIARVEQAVARSGSLEVLVNNAGFGVPGTFAGLPVEEHLKMIACLETACVRLARAALPGMLARRCGAIVNVASTAGFVALPRSVMYSTTKVAMIRFSESLALELVGTGVRVQALCPGFTHTEFHDGPQYTGFKASIPSWLWMSAEDVVSASLNALAEDRVVVIPGWANQAVALGARMGVVGMALRLAAVQNWLSSSRP